MSRMGELLMELHQLPGSRREEIEAVMQRIENEKARPENRA